MIKLLVLSIAWFVTCATADESVSGIWQEVVNNQFIAKHYYSIIQSKSFTPNQQLVIIDLGDVQSYAWVDSTEQEKHLMKATYLGVSSPPFSTLPDLSELKQNLYVVSPESPSNPPVLYLLQNDPDNSKPLTFKKIVKVF